MTAAQRILDFLELNYDRAFTNQQLGMALCLPADSIRRVINVLRKTGHVIEHQHLDRHWQIGV